MDIACLNGAAVRYLSILLLFGLVSCTDTEDNDPTVDMAPADAYPGDLESLDAATDGPPNLTMDMNLGSLDSMASIVDGSPTSEDAMRRGTDGGSLQDVRPPEPDAVQASPDANTLDVGPLEPDAARVPPELDAGPVHPDADPMRPDAAPVHPDAAPIQPDVAHAQPDAAPPEPDAAPVQPDASPIQPDAAPIQADATLVQPDAAPVHPDAAPMRPDAALVAPDAERPDAMIPDAAPQARCDDGQENGLELGIDCGGECQPCTIRVHPPVYRRALRNPLKGLTTNGIRVHEWATLAHVYIRWNELEDRVADGLDRIRRVSAQKFEGVAARNVKVIPRVYLHWSQDDQKYWPSDMRTDDYSSEQFQQRLTRLVSRLGQVWNNDPRIAFIELGIFGKWGEHHSPTPEPEMQALAARLFAEAFPDKHVSVRHAWNQFQGQGFGEYWDSFSHYDQMWPHGQRVRSMNQADDRYRTNYIGGETAYDWGGWEIQPGTTPTDSVRDPVHRNFIINTIRWLHCTQLRWIHAYDVEDEAARAGAEEVQRAMGYRFILETVEFTPEVTDGRLRVAFAVRNEGAAPFYYDWPVQVALLHPETHAVVWSRLFADVDIRTWLGGEGWPEPEWVARDHWSRFAAPNHWAEGPLMWNLLAPEHREEQSFVVGAPEGTYLLALAVVDPANGEPNLRFATSWYLNGGYHPVGLVSVGVGRGGPLPDAFVSDDPWLDQSLHYLPE